jgi:hypothetical protein
MIWGVNLGVWGFRVWGRYHLMLVAVWGLGLGLMMVMGLGLVLRLQV